MIIVVLILLFVFAVLSVPVCAGVISGLCLFGFKVFPGLFVSFILTGYLAHILRRVKINNLWLLIAVGLLTGFPNGAFICSSYKECNPEDRIADALAGIINMPSPAFLISYVYAYILDGQIDLRVFFALTYIPVILLCIIYTGVALRHGRFRRLQASQKGKERRSLETRFKDIEIRKSEVKSKAKFEAKSGDCHEITLFEHLNYFSMSVEASVNTALKLGACIILFSVITSMLYALPLIGTYADIPAYFLEISNGLNTARLFASSIEQLVMLVLFLDAFGGVCIIMQTKCVAPNISIKKYICHKLLICLVTTAFAWLMVYVFQILKITC